MRLDQWRKEKKRGKGLPSNISLRKEEKSPHRWGRWGEKNDEEVGGRRNDPRKYLIR